MEGCELYLKWVIIVFVIIVLILFILIITRLTIYVDYRHSQDDDLIKLKITFWFGLIRLHYNIPMVKVEHNADTPGVVVKEETKIGKKEKPMKNQKEKITAEDVIDRMKDINELLKHVVQLHEIIKRFLKKVSILQFDWHSGLGTGDASHTGVLVGLGWTVKGSILGIISHYLILKCTPNFSIHPFFQHLASETRLKCMIRFRLGNAMLVGIRLVKFWKGGRPHFRTNPFSTKKNSHIQ